MAVEWSVLRRSALVGMGAGLVSATLMGALAVIGAVVAGRPWYMPLELAGSVVGSSARLDAGLQAGDALAGLCVHEAVGAVWGGLFGLVAQQLLLGEGIAWGALFGVVVWVIDLCVALPIFDRPASQAIPLWFGAIIHIVYGCVLAIAYGAYRSRRWSRSPG